MSLGLKTLRFSLAPLRSLPCLLVPALAVTTPQAKVLPVIPGILLFVMPQNQVGRRYKLKDLEGKLGELKAFVKGPTTEEQWQIKGTQTIPEQSFEDLASSIDILGLFPTEFTGTPHMGSAREGRLSPNELIGLHLHEHIPPAHVVESSLAACANERYTYLAAPFYLRARSYAEADEMSCWSLMANFEAQQTMLGLHRIDEKSQSLQPTLAPPQDWVELE
ncbi:hypothetical protein GQ53DRAFT_756823 [Thozetella sp. PMI_491]|nr:hypothetical protein GQ53DRAFT_756823 [Thozetella sp. PMI_491]